MQEESSGSGNQWDKGGKGGNSADQNFGSEW